ncbi:hypothetical protein [uncultured Ruegeria sp.]|uniref:hypothetical protein n=1 Tax=uncultured Ruegeria sp. TaxID=259304 RepID=UPI002620DC02|nr:hypothetical protein [uncultured Ruegeria sp.]
MKTPIQTPRPDDAPAPPRTGETTPSSHGSPSSGAFSSFPDLGDEVRFQRSPTHHPELGIVRGRVFGTRAIEIVDMNGKPLRLEAGQYEVTNRMPHSTHGRQPPSGSTPGTGGGTDTSDCVE